MLFPSVLSKYSASLSACSAERLFISFESCCHTERMDAAPFLYSLTIFCMSAESEAKTFSERSFVVYASRDLTAVPSCCPLAPVAPESAVITATVSSRLIFA